VNKTIAKQIGVDAALLLGSLCSFGNLFAKAGGEFFVTIENLCDDTCLSRHKVKAALKTLSDTNIISIQKKGLPSRNYYTINSHKLQELLELQPVKTRIRSSWSKISPLVG
jgi:predicted transcriptional regulator